MSDTQWRFAAEARRVARGAVVRHCTCPDVECQMPLMGWVWCPACEDHQRHPCDVDEQGRALCDYGVPWVIVEPEQKAWIAAGYPDGGYTEGGQPQTEAWRQWLDDHPEHVLARRRIDPNV